MIYIPLLQFFGAWAICAVPAIYAVILFSTGKIKVKDEQ